MDITTRQSPVRVGTDLVRIADVEECLERHGSRYAERVFTEHELASCTGEPSTRAARLAARFAAKEAALKVLRPADDPLDWRSIEVVRDPLGPCEIRLTGTAARLAERAGIGAMAVSLSHEGTMAAAVVVALCNRTPEGDVASFTGPKFLGEED